MALGYNELEQRTRTWDGFRGIHGLVSVLRIDRGQALGHWLQQLARRQWGPLAGARFAKFKLPSTRPD